MVYLTCNSSSGYQLLTFKRLDGMNAYYLVTCEVRPSSSNPEGRFYNQIPLKSNNLYTNRKRDQYFVYKIFTYKKAAEKEIDRLFKIYDRQYLEYRAYGENKKDKSAGRQIWSCFCPTRRIKNGN